MRHAARRTLAALTLTIPAAALAGDSSQLGPTVLSLDIEKGIPPANLSLKNASQSKIASKRELVVEGPTPRFTVSAKAYCKPGAKLTSLQVILGEVLIHNNAPFSVGAWGQSPKQNQVVGHGSARLDIPVDLTLTRKDTKAAVDLTFNPVLAYEFMLDRYVEKGHTPAEYLRETQAFDMIVPVNLVVTCKMDANADSWMAGKTYAGLFTREVPVTILYNGDPAIVDGPAPRAKSSAKKAEGGPPVRNR